MILSVSINCYELRGSVFDVNLNAVDEAVVYINNEVFSVTDINGFFSASDLPSRFNLKITHDDFEHYERQIVLDKNSVLSIMLKKKIINTKKVAENIHGLSIYGLTGGQNIIYPFVNKEKTTYFGYTYFRISQELPKKLRRNSSGIKFLYTPADDFETGFTIFVVEDDDFQIMNEEHIFSFKYYFSDEGYSVGAVLRGSELDFNYAYGLELESNLFFAGNIFYHTGTDKFRLDTSVIWVVDPNLEVSVEFLRDADNVFSTYVYSINVKNEDLSYSIFTADNDRKNYKYSGISVNMKF
ncbi:MAG: hypothetical protein WC337_02890 [Candidatus Muiribacteriota bacterium]